MNINNPHFVIMQGKITQVVTAWVKQQIWPVSQNSWVVTILLLCDQVLNMKPLRILGMVEEAAGVSVYDKRKAKAKQRLAENEAKLTELDKVVRNHCVHGILLLYPYSISRIRLFAKWHVLIHGFWL